VTGGPLPSNEGNTSDQDDSESMKEDPNSV
jgi:hypothetical protein